MTNFSMWVVYEHPSDRPDVILARKWIDGKPSEITIEGETLDSVRAQLPPGLARIPRNQSDDPVIVESWL